MKNEQICNACSKRKNKTFILHSKAYEQNFISCFICLQCHRQLRMKVYENDTCYTYCPVEDCKKRIIIN